MKYDINDARSNLRKILQQFELLADHLQDDARFCERCINKHFLMLTGLVDESTKLNNSLKVPCINDLNVWTNDIYDLFISNPSNRLYLKGIGQGMRLARAHLVKLWKGMI